MTTDTRKDGATHAAGGTRTFCGLVIRRYGWVPPLTGDGRNDLRVSSDPKQVTCRTCCRIATRRAMS